MNIKKSFSRLAILLTLAFAFAFSSSAETNLSFAPDMGLNTVSSYVKSLQQYLNSNGFYVSKKAGEPGSPGYETDTFGGATKQALVKFQLHNGILATGFFGPKTKNAIALIASNGRVLGVTTDINSLTCDPFPSERGSLYRLNITANGPGQVRRIIQQSGGISITDKTGTSMLGAGVYEHSCVKLDSIPNDGAEFTGWGGYLTGTTTPTLLAQSGMPSQDVTIYANFASSTTQYTLTVSKPIGNTGTGLISSSPLGIDCGNDCDEKYDENTSVTLTATPDADSYFDGWSGACSGTATCTVTMDYDKSVDAIFTKKPKLTTIILTTGGPAGVDGGSVTSYPRGIDCGTDCDEYYDLNSYVELTATPSAGYKFTGWTADASGTSTTVSVSMSYDKRVYANFEKETKFKLTTTAIQVTSINGTGKGAISVNPTGTSCGADCNEYTASTSVTITATPDSKSKIDKWDGGGCSGTDETCTTNVSSELTVKVYFEPKNKCAVIGYGGINSDGLFTNKIDQIVEEFEEVNSVNLFLDPIYRNGYNRASQTINQAPRDIQKARNKKAKKIFAAFHSLSSIGAFNAITDGIIDKKNDLRVVLYDPPYDISIVNWTPKWIAGWVAGGNPAEIQKAKANGIATNSDTVNLTNGTAEPESLHENYTQLETILNEWLNENCK